jgi:ribokinase
MRKWPGTNRLAPPRVAVLGSLNVDYLTYVECMPSPGETVLAAHGLIEPGGKGGNQAHVLGRLGAHVAMFGAVGRDASGDLVLDRLNGGGVDVASVERADQHTGFATIAVQAGENRIIVAAGANNAVTPEYVRSKLDELARFDVILMQLEIPLETVVYAAQELKRRGKFVILDPAPAPVELPAALLEYVDVVKPNSSELRRLSGTDDLADGMSHLLACGAGCVVASRGADGAAVAIPDRPLVMIPADEVTAVDTTGAGDSLTASLAYGIGAGRSVESAARFGVGVAGLVVQRRGAQKSVPSQSRLHEVWVRTEDSTDQEVHRNREMTG